jgi:hypothetical protein
MADASWSGSNPACPKCSMTYEVLRTAAEQRIAHDVKEQTQRWAAQVEQAQREERKWYDGVVAANALTQREAARVSRLEQQVEQLTKDNERLRAEAISKRVA